MSQSVSFVRRIHAAARPVAARLFAIPYLGYGLRIPVGILKLPRFNLHLRRLDTGVQKLEKTTIDHNGLEARIAPLSARVAALEPLGARVADLEPLNARVADLESLNARVVGLESLNARVATLEPLSTRVAELESLNARVADLQSLSARVADLEPLNARLATLESGWRQRETRLDSAGANIQALWDRMEFVRREILFEMAHGRRSRPETDNASTGSTSKLVASVIAPDKIAAARANGRLRLNLGCGHVALPDYVNVDMRNLPGVDVIADVGDLPFERGTVDEIFSAHMLEHFPQEAMCRQFLPYWRDLLRPGGVFRAVTPDAAAMLAGAGAGTYSFEEFREVVFGSQDYVGDYHYNLFTPDSLRDLLEDADFDNIEVPVSGRRNGKCFEFEIVARRA